MSPIVKWLRLAVSLHITLMIASNFARHAITIRKAMERTQEQTDAKISISFRTERRSAFLFLVFYIVPGSAMWNVLILPSSSIMFHTEAALAVLALLMTSWSLMYPILFLDTTEKTTSSLDITSSVMLLVTPLDYYLHWD
jgi:hypothetical protein